MYYLIVRALTDAVFFVGAALGHNNMVDCHVFFVEPPSTCQFESFKDAEWRVEGAMTTTAAATAMAEALATAMGGA